MFSYTLQISGSLVTKIVHFQAFSCASSDNLIVYKFIGPTYKFKIFHFTIFMMIVHAREKVP